MTLWRRVVDAVRWVGAHVRLTRTFDSAPRPIDQMIGEMLGRGLTPRASRAEALSVPAILRGRNVICSVATLPLRQLAPDRTEVPLPLLGQIDPDVPNLVTLSQTVEDLLFEGIAWWRVLQRGADGYPTAAQHCAQSSVSLQPPATMRPQPSPLPGGHDPRDASVWVNGDPVPAREMIRFDSPNPGVLHSAGRTVRRALLLDQLATLYANDPRPLDFFTPDPNADEPEDDDVRDILSEWAASRRERSTAYVPKALKYNTVDAPSPADLQLVELQRQAALEIANALGLDPEDLGISTTSRTYANVVDRRQDKINDVLAPYMLAITQRLSMGDVTKRGYRVVFDVDDYLRSNPTERANVQKIYLEMGVVTRDEIRAAENLPGRAPEPEQAAADPAATVATVTPLRPREAAAAGRTASRFDDRARFTADLPVVGFKVDRTKRTIEGVVLPYGEIASKGYERFRFLPGALQYGEQCRVKLLRDHDYGRPLGVMIHDEESDGGRLARWRIARGADGDEALSLAEDGVLDGLSVGVDFEPGTDTTYDADNGVTLVHRADWRETSLTAMPAFDSARVTSVAASRSQGDPMDPCTTCGQPHAPGVACGAVIPPPAAVPPTPPPVSPTGLTQDMAAAFAAFMQTRQPAAPEGPTFVNPVRQTAATRVTDAAPYRFDRQGNLRPGTHEFSADLIAALRDGDAASHQRALAFVQRQFDVITTDVNELNPTTNRPDLYVDQRSFRYPMWEAINKGTLTDITPFTFPKFSSAGSLVAAHTEGVEPSSGTFVTTSATVTPTAISGKAKISRETWDQGGNPQIGNLIWQQMLKGWYEALEAAAVTLLDAASPTQIDLSGTPGLANEDLDQALTQAFAALQFVRGGFSMDNLFTQIDLYKALIAAVDANGRRLYPAFGPANAIGTVRPRWGALDLNGITALPAWALAATGSVVASSYLFDSDSVHGWASTPQRLTIDMTEVANVYIGIWGYKAAVISDTNGVREILYDPI
jgi:HK97 family phage prohead protease